MIALLLKYWKAGIAIAAAVAIGIWRAMLIREGRDREKAAQSAAQAARVQAANRARASVDQSDEAIRADKNNRDNWK